MTDSKRADATRNRDRILDAARDAFADPEADVSMAEVARLAGVGSATLYRNFPNRRALLEALYLDEVDAVVSAAAGASLRDWLRHFYGYFTSKIVVATALLEHADASDPFFGAGRDRVLAAGRPLLRDAQQAGDVRDDVTLEQLLQLVVAVAKIPGDDAYREPLLQTLLDGLTPRGGPGRASS